ncbi:ClpX C4-type zinc finger protein [Streptomyces sp. NPDC054813]
MRPHRRQHPPTAGRHRHQPRLPRTPFGRRSRRARGGKKQPDRCSFCGHPRSEERRLVAGPEVWICSDCVVLCGEILAQPADA